MHALIRRSLCAATAVFLLACARGASVASGPTPADQVAAQAGDTSIVVNRLSISWRDTSLIAAAALSIADSARGVEVRLDPRRLPSNFDAPDAIPSRTDMASDPAAGTAKVGGTF